MQRKPTTHVRREIAGKHIDRLIQSGNPELGPILLRVFGPAWAAWKATMDIHRAALAAEHKARKAMNAADARSSRPS